MKSTGHYLAEALIRERFIKPAVSHALTTIKRLTEFLDNELEELVCPPSVRENYNELLHAVESKHGGETRHQTALRYIQEAETAASQNAHYREALEMARRQFNEILTIHWGWDGDCGALDYANDGFDAVDAALKAPSVEPQGTSHATPLDKPNE